MVRKGEYLERAVVIPGAPALEGLYHRGKGGAPVLVAPSHPERGGGMESPVIAELAWALTRAGHATLRFNYPGVGASGGDFDVDRLDGARDRALEHLVESTGVESLGFVGVGLGGPLLLDRLLGSNQGPLVWVMPDRDAPRPSLKDHPGEIFVVLAEDVDPDLRESLEAWVEEGPAAALRWVPGADRWFRRGLVTLGRVVVELFDPPGLVNLPLDD